MGTLFLYTGTGSDLASARGSWNSKSKRLYRKQAAIRTTKETTANLPF